MTKRKMYLRMIIASLSRRRSRMLVALLAVAVGATIISGLLTIYYDVPRQMGAQFRNYGANMVFIDSGTQEPFDMEAVEKGVSYIDREKIVGVAPYRYETVRIHEQPVVAAGTDMEQAKAASPYWKVSGEWPQITGDVLVGKAVAEKLNLSAGSVFNVTFSEAEDDTKGDDKDDEKDDSKQNKTDDMLNLGTDMQVSGILETGGSEEDYIYMSMEDLEGLTGEGDLDVAELSISAGQDELKRYERDISANVSAISPRLVKRVTQSESTVLTKLQGLVFIVTAVVLGLTMICVTTTMTAVVTERRKEIGLRKALGASDKSIIREFMGEGLLLGIIGGAAGTVLGYLFAQFVSMNVFAGSIAFAPVLIPITIGISVGVTALACLLPVRSATDIDPAVVLKGE